MKSTIAVVLVGVILFAISAGASWFLINNQKDKVEETADQVDDPDKPVVFPPMIDQESLVSEMPVALRPDVPITVEAVTELAQSIMKKQQELVESEKRLKKEEKRIKLLFEDLRQEREELQAFGQRIDNKVSQAREAAELLKLQFAKLNDQSKALAKLENRLGKDSGDVEADRLANRIKIAKEWMIELEPEVAAKHIKQFADDGQLEIAGAVLNSLDKRDIAKILAVLDDTSLVGQLLDAYSGVKADASTREAKRSGRGNTRR